MKKQIWEIGGCLSSQLNNLSDKIIGGVCGETLTWHLDNNSLVIEGSGDMYNYSTDEPAPWNEMANQVTKIVLPDGITRIGSYAFYNCTGVASITFTDNDCAFPKTAFSSMTKTYLVIDDSKHKDFALNANTYSKVTIKCKLNTTDYGTIIMPFTPGIQAKNDFYFYKIRSLEDNQIQYTRVTSPQANVPYVYKNASTDSSTWASEITSANNVTIKATEAPFTSSGEWKMIGNYQNMTITDTDRLSYTYMMSNNSLVNTSEAVTIYPLHPYFEGPKYGNT